MIQNYIITAFRTIRKNKVITFINLFGLILGMSSFILITKYVYNELGYDDFHSGKDKIYRVQLDRYNQGKLSAQLAAGCPGIGPAMLENIPEVKNFVKIHNSSAMVSYGEKVFRENRFFYASEDFFKVFDFKLIEGIDSLVLKEPYTVVLSESTAKRYFDNEDPIGKILSHNGHQSFKVTGIFKDVPANSHMKFDALYSFETFATIAPLSRNSFQWDGFYTYVLLQNGTNTKSVESKLPALVEKYTGEKLRYNGTNMIFHLQPLTSIHLNSNYLMEFETNGQQKTIYFLSVIALLILVIAWANYINLVIMMSLNRLKEVGIRKVIGSSQFHLFLQFTIETFIINFFAIIISVVLANLLIPMMNEITGRHLTLFESGGLGFWLMTVVLFVGGGIVASGYPTLMISKFKPIEVVKGKSVKFSTNRLRQMLVIFEFAVSVILITSTLIVLMQLDFLRKQDFDVNIDQTLVVRGPNVHTPLEKGNNYFKIKTLNLPSVSSLTISTSVPGREPSWNVGGIVRLGDNQDNSQQFGVIGIDENYVNYYGLTILEGRNFSGINPDVEIRSVLFNESAIDLMGFKSLKEAIGQKINFLGDTMKIVGVIKDFHNESVKKIVQPLIFRYFPYSNYYSYKINKGHFHEAVIGLEKIFRESFPGNEYEYFFLEEHFNQQYKSEILLGRIFRSFSALAVLIACLGLFGLIGFISANRTQEIGIRKTLGATNLDLNILLSSELFKLIFFAWIIAIPLVWWLSNKWLQDFAYHISLHWWLFAGPGVAVLLIAWITISYHIIKVCNLNPTESLRASE